MGSPEVLFYSALVTGPKWPCTCILIGTLAILGRLWCQRFGFGIAQR
jgi:hypothetical protein